ncbi:MAG TPA: oligosaccharide flippase family protein [Sphingomonas sp.]
MTLANLVILCLTAASYIVYSRLLTPTGFAIIGTALTCSRVCVQLLDGGVRTVLIADRRPVDRARYTAISVALFTVSTVLIAGGAALSTILDNQVPGIGFVLIYVVPFLLSYPLFFSSMVRLEKELRYGPIAIIEAGSVLIELVLPALLIVRFGAGPTSFIVAAVASRLVRTFCFWLFVPPAWGRFAAVHLRDALSSLRTSLWFQYTILANAVRDNLPILLVAPVYGTGWAGYYVWALQICAVSSQFAVAAASRIALPVISGLETAESRYDVSAQQIAWLSKLLGPVLIAVWLVTPAFDILLFDGKWSPALALLPWLLLRMMPGIATTILYPLVFVQFGPRWLAAVSSGWTAIEIGAALLALWVFGPAGLAYSYALCVWLGVMLMAIKIRDRPDFSMPGLWWIVMGNRPSIAAFLAGLVIMAMAYPAAGANAWGAAVLLLATGTTVLLAYLLDDTLRAKLLDLAPIVRTMIVRRKRVNR